MRQVFATLAVVILSAAADAADWPMWRYDAARSAASPDPIGTNLTLLWSRKLPPVRQAWPLETAQRLNFDASYEPVVMGKRLFLGSQNDGSVTAYDTGTGEEKWKFYTEGPVRCAPACWQGKVYAGSDDGYLYCLDASTGKLVWKFRGAPAERPDRRQLGNGHLVSFWPVRGGPVVVDGTVYFGAGIWPIFGVFLHALDAETGKVKWTNGDLHHIASVRLDHDNLYDSGLSPQGYFVAVRDKLVVPNGRAMPAGLDRQTGQLVYFAHGWHNGDSRVAAHGDYAFVGKNALLNLYDFREVGSKWAYAGTNSPPGYRIRDPRKVDLFESPDTRAFPYKTAEGCDAASAFENGIAYGFAKGAFYAHDVARAQAVEREQEQGGNKFRPLKWEPPLIWQFKPACTGQPGSVVIKAGKRLYGSVGKKLLTLENLGGPPCVTWENDIDGTLSSIIAADDKLFVTTSEGGLHCYGEGKTGKTFEAKPLALNPKNDGWAEKVEKVLKASGVDSGYCLVLGLADGRLIEELLRQTKLLVIGVDEDEKKINALRLHFDAAGYLGARLELFRGLPFDFGFPPYIASLIVSEDAGAAGFSSKVAVAPLFNVLRPYGGTLCLELPPDLRRQFESWAKGAGARKAMARQDNNWSLLVREGALPSSASWTHEAADPASTFCSQDDLVKAPLGFLWYGDVFGAPGSPHSARKVATGGRVYTLYQEHSKQATLFAYDAYTGRLLWKNGIVASLARLAATADGVYVVGSGRCTIYEPETGKLLNTFTFNEAGAIHAKDLRVEGDVIVVACGDKDTNWFQKPGYNDSTTLVCLDRKTGVELWRREAKERFNNYAIAMGAGMVFCVDSPPVAKAPNTPPQPLDPKKVRCTVLALGARTGKEVWSKEMSRSQVTAESWEIPSRDDYLAYSEETDTVLVGWYLDRRRPIVNALAAKTGIAVWENKEIGGPPLILRGKTFENSWGTIYDILTANKAAQLGLVRTGFNGCNYALGTTHLRVMRDCSAAYCDIEQSRVYHLRNVRSSCLNNMIAADGLLNAPNSIGGCTCNYPIQTSFALVTMPEVAAWSGATPLKMPSPPALTGRTPGSIPGK